MLVSIIIPIHNAEKTLESTLESILAQTYINFELLLVLNNCIDGSEELALQYQDQDSRIRVLYENSPGAGSARNRGIEKSTGDLLAFCDADDTWLENKLDVQLQVLLSSSSDFVSASYYVERDGLYLRTQKLPNRFTALQYENKDIVVGCSTVLVKKSAVGTLRFPTIRLRQDFIFFVRLLKDIESRGGSAVGVEEPLVVYKVHSNGISSNKFKASYFQFKAYKELGYSNVTSILKIVFYIYKALNDRV